MDIIAKRISSWHRLMVFLVSVVSFLLKNLTAVFIFNSLINRYTLIESTDNIVTFSLSFFNFSNIPFRSEAWTMEKREEGTFTFSNNMLIPS